MIKLNFNEVEKAFNKLLLRERIIIFSGLLICIISAAYFWIATPAMEKQAKAEQALQLSYEQENKLNSEIAELILRLQKDPLQEINNKIASSLQTLSALDKQLDKKLVKFIHAQKMPTALAKVLSKSPGVKVESLISLPIESIRSSAEIVAGERVQNLFYKHTLELQLSGDYNAIYQYLLNLESLQEKFYWLSITYQVSDYPLARVTLQIYTLSDQQDLVSG
jgi:MSHA biogenesis protein MshJ